MIKKEPRVATHNKEEKKKKGEKDKKHKL